jgi:acyl dehydratase
MNEAVKTKYQVTIGNESSGRKVLRFDQISVGDELPPYTKWITAKSAIKFGATYKDVFSGHINPKVSEGQFGVGSMPVQGAVLEAGLTSLIVNWLGSAKPWLCGGRQESKFIQVVVPGDTLRYRGTVTQKVPGAAVNHVMVDIHAENQRAEKCMVGTARVAFTNETTA